MKGLNLIKAVIFATAFACVPFSYANNNNNSTVADSKNAMSDTGITTKVKGAFVKEKLFGDKEMSVTGVNVETVNGVVTLTGTVDTQAQADNAVKIAKTVDGVKQVNSKLEVKPAN